MMHFLFTHTPLLYFIQSLWRDEAFSVLVAKQPLLSVLPKMGFEPPVYYTLLHFWIKIFGTSELSVRGLSFTGFTLATIIVIYWAEKLFPKSWISLFLPIFFFFNPMLIYYGFEVRTYGWYIFFATASMWAYINRSYRWYILVTILGFYTHTYFMFTFFAQAVHFIIFDKQLYRKSSWNKIWLDHMVQSMAIITIAITPWLLYAASISKRLSSSWYFPVDLQLVKSVLGNMFIGYEGTPWFLWKNTAWLSLGILIAIGIALGNRANRRITSYFACAVFVPLSVVIGLSFIKPLFVNRYLIPVTIGEVFLVVYALSAVSNKFWSKLIGVTLLGAMALFLAWYPPYIAKVPIRNTIQEINGLQTAQDRIYVASSLVFFETLYYSQKPDTVFLYNPSGSAFPWYVGDAIFDKKKNVTEFPVFPQKAFLVSPDGTYRIVYQTRSQQTLPENKP